MNAIARIASPRATLAGLVILALGAVVHGTLREASAAWVVVPLLALAANLAAAIACNPAFRRDGPLLAFHLALLAVLLLAAIGRLTYLRGQVELAEGEIFAGQLTSVDAGPLHANALGDVRFVNDGFSTRYAAGLKRAETRNRLRVFGGEREAREQVIGDNEPLRLAGYRFYTSFNKGYSLVFQWFPASGVAPQRGTVNLPAYPAHEAEQALEWKLPGGPALWTQLEFDQPPLDAARETWFRKPDAHRVVVRVAEQRWELGPGGQARLAGGTLVYEGLTTWMGYNVFYDWTLPWLLAACVAAAAALGWHLARRFTRVAWDA
jgi:cytochrome c biogenesis protein